MSVHEEEDFELVLGNRQIFFLAVVLFGVFFSIGYTVGYSRGSESADDVAAATHQPAPATSTSSLLPAAEPEVPREPAVEAATPDTSAPASNGGRIETADVSVSPAAREKSLARAESEPARSPSSTPAPASSATAASSSASARAAERVAATPPAVSRGSRTEPRAETAAASTTPSTGTPSTGAQAQAAPTPTVAVPAPEPGALYLQVLASRDADPAREALVEMKAKGHSVTLDSSEAGWHRILIGPFHKQEEAAQYQLRLKTEGIDSFVRAL